MDIAGLKSEHELFTALVTYKEFADTRGPGTRFIFLDEVTAVTDWQTAIKKAGGGILLTRDSLAQRQDNLMDIPVHLFLALIKQ